MTDDLETLAGTMEDLGLGPEETKVYLTLLDNGPARASTAANLAGFSRGRTYRILDTLVEEGWVVVHVGHPRIFEASPPERLFEGRISQLQREEMRVEDLRDDLLPRLLEIGQGVKGPKAANWTLLEGRLAIYRSLIKLVERAEETVHVASNHAATSSSTPVIQAAWQALAERLEAGVTARCLVPPDWQVGGQRGLGEAGEQGDGAGQDEEASDGDPGVLPDIEGLEIRRMGHQPPVHIVIIDGREAIQWLVMDVGDQARIEGDVAVKSDAAGLVGPARLLFETLWEKAAGEEGTPPG